MKNFKLKNGWIPDRPDHRDHQFALRLDIRVQLPASVDLRPSMPPIWDQGDVGSCVGHGVAAAHYVAQKLSGAQEPILPSRLFVYYNGRAIDGTVRQDAGTYIRSAVKGIAKLGVAEEKLWKYNTMRWATKPAQVAYINAMKHQALTYQRIDNTSLYALHAALAAGMPIAFGATLYDSFYKPVDNVIPMPALSEQAIGGHCMAIAGYDDTKQAFLIRNSWGKTWCDGGYHWMPYAYISSRSLCDDFWVLQTVEV
jgi:C1A family cysteine protease